MTAKITIEGNLAADPDFGVSTTGTSWARMRVASHERVKRNGEWVSTDPEFFNIALFGEAAERAANSLHKGDRVSVEGRPELELFDRRDGSTGATMKVYARSVRLAPIGETAARNGGSGIAAGADTAQGMSPTLHHTADATMVVNVGRTATAMHRTLKEHGFRWAAATTSWNLPSDMDEHTRAARVSDLLSAIRENGRDLPVVTEPVPNPARPAPAAPAPAPPAPATQAGRSL